MAGKGLLSEILKEQEMSPFDETNAFLARSHSPTYAGNSGGAVRLVPSEEDYLGRQYEVEALKSPFSSGSRLFSDETSSPIIQAGGGYGDDGTFLMKNRGGSQLILGEMREGQKRELIDSMLNYLREK